MVNRRHKQMRVRQEVSLLLPPFRPYVEELLRRMKRRGLRPLVWETLRSEERAAWLFEKGKSRNNGRISMHCLGAAVDIVCRDHLWNHPEFFVALGEEAAKMGLTWGGDWDSDPETKNKFNDRPHVQCIRKKDQNKFRALASDAEREKFAVRVLKNTGYDLTGVVDAPAYEPPRIEKSVPYSPVDTSDRTDAENEAQACLPEDEG